jgi:hypothetical protein
VNLEKVFANQQHNIQEKLLVLAVAVLGPASPEALAAVLALNPNHPPIQGEKKNKTPD